MNLTNKIIDKIMSENRILLTYNQFLFCGHEQIINHQSPFLVSGATRVQCQWK